MRRRQLVALFVINLVPYTIGQTLIGLLPVYVLQLGMDEIGAGVYLGLAFGSLAAATLLSGWLSDHFQRRRLLIILAGAVSVPVTLLMGHTTTIPVLTLATVLLWGFSGVTLTMANILTGMYADPAQRGRTFGIMGITIGLGAALGGFLSGAIVDHWGYPALFTLAAPVWALQVIAGLLLEDRSGEPVAALPAKSMAPASAPLGFTLWLLIAAHAAALVAMFSANLGRPLIMNALGFDVSAITSTISIGGLVALPLPFLIGWLSDRISRRWLLILTYLVMSAGVFVLAPAAHLWQFCLSTILLTTNVAALSVGLAYVNDLASPAALATATARFSASPWIAGVIGFGGTGFVIQMLGLQTTFLLVALFPLISVLLVIAITRQPHLLVEHDEPVSATQTRLQSRPG